MTTTDSSRGRGRPPIGPKVQSHVPPEVWSDIQRTMKRRKTKQADVVRELVLLGWEVKYGKNLSDLEGVS